MRLQNDDQNGAREKMDFQNKKETRVFLNAFETKNKVLRTLSTRENSFEYDYYFLSSELRQNKLAETNERTLVLKLSYAN